MKQLFIRIDKKGHWRGRDHVSSIQGQAGECVCFEDQCICGADESWESGISCYRFDDSNPADAFRELLEYWTKIASCKRVEDYSDLQITIFSGELTGTGSDGEDTATCEKTIVEIEAKPVMEKILEEFYDEKYCGEKEDTEKFEKTINELNLLKN